MTVKPNIRAAAIELLRSGLATQSEAAALAGVSRQLIVKWLRIEDFDPIEQREAFLHEAWRKCVKRARR